MATERVSLARLWALMATVFVDMMGFLMVMPVLPMLPILRRPMCAHSFLRIARLDI